MRGSDQHLSSQEIQELAGFSADALPDSLEDAMHHVGSCDECRLRMLLSDELGLPSFSKTQSAPHAKTPACPPDSTWLQVAAGLESPDESRRQIQHASVCKRCGQLLRIATEDLAVELSSEEEEKIAALGSLSPEWQRSVAERIAGGPVKSQIKKQGGARPGLLLWRWAFVAAALVVAAGCGWFLWESLNPDPNKLLAEAYTQHRTIELRMPGAAYGPMDIERGNGNNDFPAQFYRAKRIILSSRTRKTVSLLQAQANADLLQWNFDEALTEVDQALFLKPHDRDLLLDKAMALYERAKKSNTQLSDYREAATTLTEVLTLEPDNKEALFNRAIIFEDLHLPVEGLSDCEHYLRIEQTGGWAQEITLRRNRLKGLEEPIKASHDRK